MLVKCFKCFLLKYKSKTFMIEIITEIITKSLFCNYLLKVLN